MGDEIHRTFGYYAFLSKSNAPCGYSDCVYRWIQPTYDHVLCQSARGWFDKRRRIFDIELTEPIDYDAAVERMNATMVEGIEVVNMVEISDDKKRTGMSIVAAADYLSFAKNHAFPDDWKEKADIFLDQPQIMIVKKTKKSEKEVDIKPMIYQLRREMKKSTCRLPQEVWKI